MQVVAAVTVAVAVTVLAQPASAQDDELATEIDPNDFHWQCTGRGVPEVSRNFDDLVPFDMSGLPNTNFCRSCDSTNCDECNNNMYQIRDGQCGWNTGQYHYGGGGIGWVTVDLGEPVKEAFTSGGTNAVEVCGNYFHNKIRVFIVA